jgi:hypothetical protein
MDEGGSMSSNQPTAGDDTPTELDESVCGACGETTDDLYIIPGGPPGQWCKECWDDGPGNA